MNSGEQFGKILIIGGLSMAVLGLVVWLGSRVSWLRLGRLPGDIVVEKPGFSFFFPITTMILLSVVLTLAAWIVRLLQR